MILWKLPVCADLKTMKHGKLPTQFQHRMGILLAGMAAAIAVTPLALALALRNTASTPLSSVAIVAGLTWLLAFVTHRALARAHERRRRGMLRSEIADTRAARVEATAGFQDALNEQFAVLDRIINISETLLTEGIIDPSRALDSIGLMNSRAREAQDLIENALAEIGIESGSTKIALEQTDTRTLIEDVAAPFIRKGKYVTTSGPQHIAETDPKVLRLVLRGLIESAFDLGATEIDISVLRNESSVVCTVADDGPDQSGGALAALSPVTKALAFALGGNLGYDRALDWNRHSISLAEATDPIVETTALKPMDVLGTVGPSQTPTPKPVPEAGHGAVDIDDAVTFAPAS
jgi:signal transduction histidine kinase